MRLVIVFVSLLIFGIIAFIAIKTHEELLKAVLAYLFIKLSITTTLHQLKEICHSKECIKAFSEMFHDIHFHFH